MGKARDRSKFLVIQANEARGVVIYARGIEHNARSKYVGGTNEDLSNMGK